MARLTNMVIGIAIMLLITSFILPIAINQFTDVNTTGWDADIVTIWDILPIMSVLGLAIGIIAYAVARKLG